MSNERDKTVEASASENSVTGDDTHFIQSVYATLASMRINPTYIVPSVTNGAGETLLFGIPETKVGVAVAGAEHRSFVDDGWTIVQLNASQLRVFHRIYQALSVLAAADSDARDAMKNRPSQEQD